MRLLTITARVLFIALASPMWTQVNDGDPDDDRLPSDVAQPHPAAGIGAQKYGRGLLVSKSS